MRRALCVMFVVGLGLFAVRAPGKIAQSHHDFTNAWWPYETCAVCHTPHHADLTVPGSPLWNHRVTNATFTPYDSSTLDASISQPSSTTKLCLSCHDGTVAVDSFGDRVGSRFIIASANIGLDLRKHHPVSFTYDAALAIADGEIHDPTTTPSGLGGTIDEDFLMDGRMECSSCHDVHVSRNEDGCMGCHFVHGATTKTLSLHKDNDGSALCLTCHKK